jgi:hypothetical protein
MTMTMPMMTDDADDDDDDDAAEVGLAEYKADPRDGYRRSCMRVAIYISARYVLTTTIRRVL